MAERLRSMSDAELGAALSSLDVAFPEPSVDLAALAVARIRAGEAAEPGRGRSLRRWVAGLVPRRGVRRVLVIALLVVALTSIAAGAAFLGVRGIQIVFDQDGGPTATGPGSPSPNPNPSPSPSPTLPSLTDRLELGDLSTLEEARAAADFDVAIPPDVPGFGDPLVFLIKAPYVPRVSFVWVDADGEPKLLLTQFKAYPYRPYIEKIVFGGGTVSKVGVNGETGYWLSGAAHELDYVDEDGLHFNDRERLVGNALVWTRGDVTLRLEGPPTLDEALSIARNTR